MNTDIKKILVLGATGAMATYMIPELLKKGYQVDGISLDEAVSHDDKLTYIKGDAKDISFLQKLLKNDYDSIVDFMVYPSLELFKKYYKLFLENTKHYIFLSTYRVYADDSPLSEDSKRLLDVEKPDDFVTEFEYSIYKAQQEDFLNNSGYKHYTIVRPAITYSKKRFQLTTLEADVLIYRMLQGKTVVLPESAMNKQATMSWAGDVAKMFEAIILNPSAFGQTFNVSASEHMTWREIAEIYEEIGGLKYVTVDDDTYVYLLTGNSSYAVYARQQLLYDRCFDRIVENSKILAISNMKQCELMPLKEGLKMEFSNITLEDVGCNCDINARMDEYIDKLTNQK